MPEEQGYRLGRKWMAASRLNLQHYFLLQHLDNQLLDPVIPKESSDLVIGDVCCGTGIWLLSLAQQLPPSTQFHAFDISFEQFLQNGWIPPNVHCHKYNIFDEPPEDMTARFDIVNISLAVSFVTDQNFDSVIVRMMKMLKPGGYLQWQEIDVLSAEYPCPNRDTKPQYVNQVLTSAWDYIGRRPPSWISQLEKRMEAADLMFLNSVRPAWRPESLHVSTQMVLMGMEEFISTMNERTGLTVEQQKSLDNCSDILANSWKEHQETGASVWIPFVRAVGRKQQ